MRGLTLRILLCLALGLVTTVAIAWTCAAIVPVSDRPPLERQYVDTDGAMVWELIQTALGRSRINYIRGPYAQFGAYDDEFPGLVVPFLDAMSILRPDDAGSEERAGWPFPALTCRSNDLALKSSMMSFTIRMEETKVTRGIPLKESAANEPWRALPYQPIWIGLLLDVAIFGCAWMTILYFPRPIRARLRQLRGECPVCGYDLRGELKAGCPECGWRRASS
jgi:hypothetical protein